MYKVNPKLEALGIFIISLLIFTISQGHHEFIAFEARFALFAKNMLANGVGLFPMTYHHPYPDYPVTPTLLIYLSSKLFGHFDKFTAMLPTAIASSISLSFVYLIAALRDRRWGLYAVLFCLLTQGFLQSSRSLSMDQYVTMVTCICFYLAYSSQVLNKRKRLWWTIPVVIIGFLCRGPIGVVIPAGVLFIFFLIDRNILICTTTAVFTVVIIALMSALLLLAAYHAGGNSFVKQVWEMEFFSRLSGNHGFFSYFTDSLSIYALAYPFGILAAIGIFNKKLARQDFYLLSRSLAWALTVIIGMTFAGAKQDRYILSMVPAWSLLATYPLIASKSFCYFPVLRKILMVLFYLLPVIFLLLILVMLGNEKFRPMLFETHYTAAIVLLLLSIGLNILFSYKIFLGKPSNMATTILLAAFSFILVNISIVEPLNIYLNHRRAFVEKVEKLRQKNHAALVFYKQLPDDLPIKYLVDAGPNLHPYFIQNDAQLLHFPKKAFFVTDTETFGKIPNAIKKQLKVIAVVHSPKHGRPIAFSFYFKPAEQHL